MGAPWEYEEPIVWSWTVAKFLDLFSKTNNKIVGQFHEWMAGSALLFLEDWDSKIGTVFTTHATMLGRCIAGSQGNLYEKLNNFQADNEARKCGVHSKFHVERECANHANIFSTVSQITAIEAEKVFQKKPDMILPNGLDMAIFPNWEERAIQHAHSKRRIKNFIAHYFFPYQSFDLENTMIYFTFGRYEFHNKGLDVFIKSLGRLNQAMKTMKSKKTVVAFFWVPTATYGLKTDLLQSKAFYQDIKTSINRYVDEIKVKLLNAIVNKNDITKVNLFNKDFLLEVKRETISFTKEGNPPLTTHNLLNEKSDEILKMAREEGLDNNADDKVKIVFQPSYLTGTDMLLDLSYYEAMAGGHLGVYPSYYEPWGYTPLETAALGVPAVTTDLAGFGQWIKEKSNNKKSGIYVLKRIKKSQEETVKELADYLEYFTNMPKKERLEKKVDAKKLADLADWKSLVELYIKAQNLALKRANA